MDLMASTLALDKNLQIHALVVAFKAKEYVSKNRQQRVLLTEADFAWRLTIVCPIARQQCGYSTSCLTATEEAETHILPYRLTNPYTTLHTNVVK